MYPSGVSDEGMHGLRSSLYGAAAGSAMGIPLAYRRDNADTEAAMASPEYQAFMRTLNE